EPGARVVRASGEVGEELLGVDDVLARGPCLREGREDRVQRVARLTVEIALAFDDAAGAERRGTGDEHAVADPHRPRIGVLVLDRAPGRDAAGRGAVAVDGV